MCGLRAIYRYIYKYRLFASFYLTAYNMANYIVTFTIDLPYPKKFTFKNIKGNDYGTAINRAFKKLKSQYKNEQGAVKGIKGKRIDKIAVVAVKI